MSKSNIIKVSIVVPCYNAENKILKCLQSLELVDFPVDQYEVLFIDDCSTDNTVDVIKNVKVENNRNWFIHHCKKNSGSPSRPRNIGISLAKGEFLFFLDSDDEILPKALKNLYSIAKKKDACIVRGSLIVDNNGERIVRNKLNKFPNKANEQKKIKAIISHQSTTPPALIQTKVLVDNQILWDEDIRIGEDTLFLIDVLLASSNIAYYDKPIYIYNKTVNGDASSTQTYGQRELKNHLFVWSESEKKMEKSSFSYFKVRGQVALQTVFQAITNFYTGDIDKKLFERFSNFANTHEETVTSFQFKPRFTKALQFLLDNNYQDFFQILKPRLLIAGMDLKFILAIIPDLEKTYAIEIDEWTGHDSHDVSKSKELLKWADIIFCEWLLGNAVWYSQHKLSHQKLIIRMHRFELTRDFGHQVNDDNVDCYFTVGVYILEKMLETFGYERGKVRLISNFIPMAQYETSSNDNRVFNLGIVGILPSRKGYLKALNLLKILNDQDSRYNLSVFGKMPEELSWVINDKDESNYFRQCNDFIESNNLENDLHIKGWVDTKKELKDIGFVLSVSSNDELPESFHIAPAEGFSSGNQGVFLYWNGLEYLYPDDYIFHSIHEIAEYIYMNSDINLFDETKCIGRNFVQMNYNKSKFLDRFRTMIQEL